MKVLPLAAAVVVLATRVVAEDEYWRHPRNARAAASCAQAFFAAGDPQQAAFFAGLAQAEDLYEPAGALAVAQVRMKEGHRADSDVATAVEKHPGMHPIAARVLVAGAQDVATTRNAMRYEHIAMALRTAIALDRSVAPDARAFAFALARNEMTPRNAVAIGRIILSVADDVDPGVVAFFLEVADRALSIEQPHIAGWFLSGSLRFSSVERAAIASRLVRTADLLSPVDSDAAQYSLALVKQIREPQTTRVAPSGCLVGDSPFRRAEHVQSDVRFFPSVRVERARLPEPDGRLLRRCLQLAPPLFPEAFDTSLMNRSAAERVHDPDEPDVLEDGPGRCVAESAYEIVVDTAGAVETMRMISARFHDSASSSAAAMRVEELRLRPVVMKRHYRPGRIGGTAVRANVRESLVRNCGE